MIRTIRPTPPLGAYPHDLLCGQTGIIPTSASIRIMSMIVPIDILHPPTKSDGHPWMDWPSPGSFHDKAVFNRFNTFH